MNNNIILHNNFILLYYMIKDKYELVSKAERDRVIGTSFIPSYGPLPVHNVKFNKLVQYLERMNNNLQVSNPSDYQKSIQDTIKMQLNLSRLAILNDYALKEKKEGITSNILSGLAFRSWCGLGTDIYNNIKNDLDDPNRMFVIDRICRDHDIRYARSKTHEEMKEADNIMMKDIFNEYVINFNRNFISGDYKSDFSTWTSSFYTVFNYIMTEIETGYIGKLLFYDLPKATYQSGKNLYNMYKTMYPAREIPADYFIPIPQLIENAKAEGKDTWVIEQVANQFKDYWVDRPVRERPYILNALKQKLKTNFQPIAFTFIATTLLRDRLLALGSLVAIGLKKGVETLTGYQIVDPTKHEVSDQDLENMKLVFEKLQNSYLEESGLKPIKIGDEWLNVEIEMTPIQKLNKDIQIIIEQNKAYNELNKTMMETQPMPPAPVLEPKLEPEPTEVYDDGKKQLTEEQLRRLDEYNNLYSYIDKLFSEINVEEDTVQRPYPDLPSTEMISGNTERPIVPDIEKDIKDAYGGSKLSDGPQSLVKQSSMLDIPDVEDETIEENNETGQDLKPDEIKNKMEL
jgi:hypothetical protein